MLVICDSHELFPKKSIVKNGLFQNLSKIKKLFISMKAYPLSWPRESNDNLPKSQRSGIKQTVHFNEGIDCSAEHSYQV